MTKGSHLVQFFSLKKQLTHFGLNPEDWILILNKRLRPNTSKPTSLVATLVNKNDESLKFNGLASYRLSNKGFRSYFWKNLTLSI